MSRLPLKSGVIAVCAALALTACTGNGTQGAPPEATEQVPVIAPGKPGEPAKTLSSMPPLAERPPSDADFNYVSMMIPHHRQALEMSALAPQRAGREEVRGLAARIDGAQAPEIQAMEAYLKRHNKPVPTDHGAHGSGGKPMPGMASFADMVRLKDAKGEEFDRSFLRLMIAHHEGALQMAKDVLAGGHDIFVEEMANDVIATQTNEIKRMREMRI